MKVPRNKVSAEEIRKIIEDERLQLVSVTFHKVTTGEERLIQFQPARIIPSKGIQANPNRDPDLYKLVEQNKRGEKGQTKVRSFYLSTVSKIVADGKTYDFDLV